MIKFICTFISIFFVAVSAFLIYCINTYPFTDDLAINSIAYAIMVGVLMFSAGYILNQGTVEKVRSESVKQLRKAEKAGIDSKESLDKIERLNAKIETLETALQEALKNKNA